MTEGAFDRRGSAVAAIAVCGLTATVGSGISAYAGLTDVAIVFAFMSVVLTFWLGVRRAEAVGGFLAIFLFFHALYGLSGPVAARYSVEALDELFRRPYRIDEFIIHLALATGGLQLGLLWSYVWPVRIAEGEGVTGHWYTPTQLLWVANRLILAASFMELVNMVRAGGIPIIALGKAVYQAKVEELFLTMPSYEIAALGLALFTAGWEMERRAGRAPGARVLWRVFLSLTPLMSISLVLGRRGPMLDWIMIVAVGMTFMSPLRRIGVKVVALGLVAYLALAIVTANRTVLGLALVTKDYTLIPRFVLKPENLARSINPASSEFAAAFGNFSQYVNGGDRPVMLGESYLHALAMPIPRFAYPGTKPRQISFAFRDEYFPSEGRRSSIAGTAYSAILEARMNFGSFGVGGVFFLLGAFLGVVESRRRGITSLWARTMYLLLLPLAVSFHRSDSALVFAWSVVMAGYSGVVLLSLRVAHDVRVGLRGRSDARSPINNP